MQPIHIIKKVIAGLPIEFQEIVLELRNIIFSIAPGATEKIHSKGLSYFFVERGGPVSAGICLIDFLPDHIRLGFIHGSFLPDPKKLLVGKSRYKKHLRIESYATADWDYYKDLIQSSVNFDPYTLSFKPH